MYIWLQQCGTELPLFGQLQQQQLPSLVQYGEKTAIVMEKELRVMQIKSLKKDKIEF